MSPEEFKNKLWRAGNTAWVEGNLDSLREVYAGDYISHRLPFPDLVGIEAVIDYVRDSRNGYSDIQISFEEMISEGNSIAYRYTWHGLHTGQSPSLPIPPTGKPVILKGCIVVHVENGKVVEEFEYSDYLGFLQQLGVIPPLG